MSHVYSVYILASESRELYVGITNDLALRIAQHRLKTVPESYTGKHGIERLVYLEQTTDVRAAIARQKQINGWTRLKKLELVETLNPDWRDLAEGLAAGSHKALSP